MYRNYRLSLRTTITFRSGSCKRPPPRPSRRSPTSRRLPLAEYAPVSKLRLERTRVERPRFAAIDFHTHLGRWLDPGGDWVASDLAGRRHDAWAVEAEAYLELCDRHSIETSINLDGGWDAELEANLDRLDRAHPGRFLTFCQLDWTRATAGDGFGERAGRVAAPLRRRRGARAQGLEDARARLPRRRRRAAAARRRARRAGVRRGRRARPPGADPHRRPARVLRPGRPPQRAARGAARPPRVVVLRPGVPLARAADGVVRGAGRGPSADHLRRRAPGRQRRGPRLARLAARPPAEPLRRHLGPGLRPRAPAAGGAAVRRAPSRADPVRLRPAARRPTRGWSGSSASSSPTTRPTSTPGDEVPPPAGRWTISALGLSDESLRAIYADNARRILGDGERSSDGEQA